MVAVHVAFRYQGVDWTRDFQVEDGATVHQLKQSMVQPEGGTKTDVDSFELRQRGHRVFEFEPIWEESYFDFMYLGPEEGGRRAARDLAAHKSFENAARAEEERRRREEEERRRRDEEARRDSERRAERERRQAEERAAKEQAKAPKQVEVTVRHSVEELKSQIAIRVMSNATILDVRLAVMAALGESKLSEVKLVKRQSGNLTTLSNDMPIGHVREFMSMGRILCATKVDDQSTEVSFKLTSIMDYAEQFVSLPGDKTVKDLRVKICEQAKRGPVNHVQLWAGEKELKDHERLQQLSEQVDESLILSGIALGPPQLVDVRVTHASHGHQMTVSVLDTVCMRELKDAIATASGKPLPDLRMVKRLAGGHWQSLPDSERLNGRAELHCMGGSTEQPQSAPVFEDKDLTVSICLDTSLGISQDVSVKRGSTIYSLKELLAETDPTKRTKPEDFGLSLTSAPDHPLSDGTHITEEHLQLNLLAGTGVEDRPMEQGGSISGRWMLTNLGDGEITSFIFAHQPGSEDFTGWQEGAEEITGGKLHGDRIRFVLAGLALVVSGRLGEDWRSMHDLTLTHESSGEFVGLYSGALVGPA
mmetsp:Transcript_60794/g.177659  ORF Transcript_60794/g.177659 Transcript_60794/m.177659 type:complete len:590 (-) Transcript_60794:383-2152(-)